MFSGWGVAVSIINTLKLYTCIRKRGEGERERGGERGRELGNLGRMKVWGV